MENVLLRLEQILEPVVRLIVSVQARGFDINQRNGQRLARRPIVMGVSITTTDLIQIKRERRRNLRIFLIAMLDPIPRHRLGVTVQAVAIFHANCRITGEKSWLTVSFSAIPLAH